MTVHSEQQKLRQLAESEGYSSISAFLEACVTDSVCMGICMNDGCDYTTDVEPDQDAGYCEVCSTGTVKAGLVLAGLI